MKAFSQFKNLSAFRYTGPGHVCNTVLEEQEWESIELHPFVSTELQPTQPDGIGLVNLGEGASDYFRDIAGAGALCKVRISKKNLPARVVRDRVDEMAAEVEAQTGRKPGRKERRAMMDDAELELLPRAFVKHVDIPVIFTTDGWLFVFSGTQTKVDIVITFLVTLLEKLGVESSITYANEGIQISPEAWMTGKAISDDSETITATDFAVMKGDDGENSTIRVSNRDLSYREVREALNSGYRVHQIGLAHNDSGIRFRLDHAFVFRQITPSDEMGLQLMDNAADEGFDETVSVAWMLITELRTLIKDVLTDMRGVADEEDEDEL